MNSPSCLQPIQVRHANVQDNDFRLKLLSKGNCFSPGLGLATNFPARPRSQELFQSSTDDVVIICNENSHGLGLHSSSRLLMIPLALQYQVPNSLGTRTPMKSFHNP